MALARETYCTRSLLKGHGTLPLTSPLTEDRNYLSIFTDLLLEMCEDSSVPTPGAMPLVGGAVMPHGALILDPARPEMAGELGAAARRLHEGCVSAARAVCVARPDVILLYTPHGLLGDGADLFIYTNASASGSCEWMGSWAEHRVNVKCDANAARSLLAHLKAGSHSAAGLTSFSGYDAPLRWGECVPLSFLGAALADGAQVVVLSHGPAGTVDRAAVTRGRLAETTAIGSALAEWANLQEKRVFLLVSGDLAHVHGNGRAPALPDGGPDPRYLNAKFPTAHAAAAPFEACIAQWVTSETALSTGTSKALCDAMTYVEDAMCCGIEGFVMLDAALRSDHFCGQLLAHEVPVYYGMLVATMLPAANANAPIQTVAPRFKAQKTAAHPSAASSAIGPDAAIGPDVAIGPDAVVAATGALLPALPRAARIDFQDKIVLVSGAGHGIGRAIALAFVALGATVEACDGPSEAAAAEMAETAGLACGARGRMHVSTVDFRDGAAVRTWAQTRQHVDVLVLCAGGVLGHVGGPIEEASEEAWDAIFDVNAKAAYLAVQVRRAQPTSIRGSAPKPVCEPPSPFALRYAPPRRCRRQRPH